MQERRNVHDRLINPTKFASISTLCKNNAMVATRERETSMIRYLERPPLSGATKAFDTLVKAFDPWDRIVLNNGRNSGYLERHARWPVFRLRVFDQDDGRCVAKVLFRRNPQGGVDRNSAIGFWMPDNQEAAVRMDPGFANHYLKEFNI